MGKIIGYLKLSYAASIDMRLAGKIAQEILEKWSHFLNQF